MKTSLLILFGFQVGMTGAVNHNPSKEINKREYLGSIKGVQGQPVYHLVRHFYTVQAAIVKHGHSEVLFYNQKWQLLRKYAIDDPSDLSLLLRRNTLYFRTKDLNGHTASYQQVINPAAPPPKWLCVAVNDCYN